MVKTREARDQMTARAQAAFAQWPRFEDMPEVTGGDARARVRRQLNEFSEPVITQQFYIMALYEVAFNDAEPVGRDGDFIIGKAVD